MRLLVVEDDRALAEMIQMLFELEGFQVDVRFDGEEALRDLDEITPDLMLLDVMLPGISGFDVQKRLLHRGIPTIFLTAKTHIEDRLKGLKLGADDYITKPFHNEELLLRVRALLKRIRPGDKKDSTELRAGDLTLRLKERAVYLGSRRLDLTPTEFALLSKLMRNQRECVSREQLLQVIWEVDSLADTTRTVDAHIHRLRKKLGCRRGYIKTVYGVGYKLSVEGNDL